MTTASFAIETYLTLKCTVYQYISEVLKRGSDHTRLNIGLAFYAQVFEISKSNIMVLLGAELTLSKVIINLWRICCVTFQAYAMNGDQLLGGKTARSYASMMDKARYLQKDIEVEIR